MIIIRSPGIYTFTAIRALHESEKTITFLFGFSTLHFQRHVRTEACSTFLLQKYMFGYPTSMHLEWVRDHRTNDMLGLQCPCCEHFESGPTLYCCSCLQNEKRIALSNVQTCALKIPMCKYPSNFGKERWLPSRFTQLR